MLIIEEHQIEPCRVFKRHASGVQNFSGAAFQDKLFRRLKQFPIQGREDAIQTARQHYLDTRGQFLILVVQEESAVSVWGEDKMLERSGMDSPNPAALLEKLDIDQLVGIMRNIGGVSIRDRRYGLKIYPRCFLGNEAVIWLCQAFSLSEREAIQVGQYLIDQRLIHHVTDDHPFENAELFYRFYWDEN